MDLINKQEAINEIRLYITAPNISDDETKIEGYGMNDLISRHDLIDALEQKLEDDYLDSYELLKYIKALPFAVPEQTVKVIEHDASVTDTDGYKYHRSEYLCGACKKKVLGGDEYCSHCGAKLDWSE